MNNNDWAEREQGREFEEILKQMNPDQIGQLKALADDIVNRQDLARGFSEIPAAGVIFHVTLN